MVDTIIIEVFDEHLDSKANDDSGNDDNHSDYDDDGQVEEIIDLSLLDTAVPQFMVIENCTFNHT